MWQKCCRWEYNEEMNECGPYKNPNMYARKYRIIVFMQEPLHMQGQRSISKCTLAFMGLAPSTEVDSCLFRPGFCHSGFWRGGAKLSQDRIRMARYTSHCASTQLTICRNIYIYINADIFVVNDSTEHAHVYICLNNSSITIWVF